MNKTAIITVIVIIIVILAGALIYQHRSMTSVSDQAATTTATSSDTMTNSSTTASSTAAANEKDFTVTGQNFSFSPSTLIVNKGDLVKITFKNAMGIHDFKIDEFNVATARIQGGAEATVQFVADKTGTFDYYCSVGNHRAMGMQGTLTVK